jgi:hypothetical protein
MSGASFACFAIRSSFVEMVGEFCAEADASRKRGRQHRRAEKSGEPEGLARRLRRGEHTSLTAWDMFKGFHGYVQADAHAIYAALFKDLPPEGAAEKPGECGAPPIEVGCFSPARRKYWEAAVCKHPLGLQGVRRIDAIFDADRPLASSHPPSASSGATPRSVPASTRFSPGLPPNGPSSKAAGSSPPPSGTRFATRLRADAFSTTAVCAWKTIALRAPSDPLPSGRRA